MADSRTFDHAERRVIAEIDRECGVFAASIAAYALMRRRHAAFESSPSSAPRDFERPEWES